MAVYSQLNQNYYSKGQLYQNSNNLLAILNFKNNSSFNLYCFILVDLNHSSKTPYAEVLTTF